MSPTEAFFKMEGKTGRTQIPLIYYAFLYLNEDNAV